MKKNKPECSIREDHSTSNEFRRDLFQVRPLESSERGKELQLAWRVFCEFESPDYAPEGTEEFKRCLNDEAYLSGIRYYGAFDEDKLVGVLGIREEKCHICFFFVEGKYQRLGIGTKLFRRMQRRLSGAEDHAQFLTLRFALL